MREFCLFASADFARLSFADFLKLVGAKIRLGGPKSGWTLLLSSNSWKTSLDLWRFFSKRKQIKGSSPPSENRRRVFKQPSSELGCHFKNCARTAHDLQKKWIVYCFGLLFWVDKSLVKPWQVKAMGERGQEGVCVGVFWAVSFACLFRGFCPTFIRRFHEACRCKNTIWRS